jgi:Flp pilus assembly protein TadD
MEQGLVYMSKGKNMKALEYFRKARELNPTEYLIEVNFGIALNELDRWTQAERHFMRAIELNPRSSNSYVPFARSLLGRNRVDDASKLLEQALELNLASAEIYRLILPIYLNREEYARTAKVLELAQDLLVTDPQLQFFEKLSKSRTKLAVPYGPRSDDAGGWMNYSLDLYGVGAFEQSIMASTEVLRYQPNSANAYNNIAAAYNNLSQFDLAASAAKRALELGPGFERASGNLKFSETKLAESK